MPKTQLSIALLLAAACLPCPAGVVVVANRTPAALTLGVSVDLKPPSDLTLAPGDVKPIFGDGPVRVTIGDAPRIYTLKPDTPYFIGQAAGAAPSLHEIGLPGDDQPRIDRPLPGDDRPAKPLTIPVVILVDDEEATQPAVWQARFRRRVEAASDIIERHSGVRFEVVGYGQWNSDNNVRDFTDSLREFEKEVDPKPARIAIGFTSQYEAVTGRTHLGGTRGALQRHLLMREWGQHLSERERTELLVHELGHFLGATHSPEQDTVMRPVLGDRQSRMRDFVVRFDPLNALVISIVGEEMRRRGIDSLAALSPGARQRIGQVYQAIGLVFPEDPTVKRLAEMGTPKTAGQRPNKPFEAVFAAMLRAAAANQQQPMPAKDDALAELLVQSAATAAAPLGVDGPKAFLTAVGLGLGDAKLVARLPAAMGGRELGRAQLLGEPTLAGRRDLAQHFFVSAMVVANAGATAANAAGLAKEQSDSNGGSGFSFVDLAADRAGVRFAEAVLSGRLPLARVAGGFRAGMFMPDTTGLAEGLQAEAFEEQFGGVDDERFRAAQQDIEARINKLPPYWGG
ncbi:hypothetical protein Pla175_11580 [Pirellulimonas nuda]|uniref:Matrixin n=1 Tax=Pirellulimonas nuda TaxID=2528009 RepID=A0A518D8I1_9BACT|nr:M12 family metallo-peptidase [Pirellulimonas nuda]QDU87791.1 hypothetical protein Pla175_11580 [Pirellulimonas nuda]